MTPGMLALPDVSCHSRSSFILTLNLLFTVNITMGPMWAINSTICETSMTKANPHLKTSYGEFKKQLNLLIHRLYWHNIYKAQLP